MIKSCSVVGIAILVLASADARAQTAPKPAASSLATSLSGDAKADYDSGRNLFEIGDFKGALVKFKHAFELANDPRLLWNMAACEKEQHHYAAAAVLVDRYLRDAGPRLSPETRESANGTATALRALTSTVTLEGAPEGAHVLVDGEPAAQSTLTLDLGAHELRIEHPEREPFEKHLDNLTGGSAIVIRVAMKPLTGARLEVTAAPGETIAIDGTVMGNEHWDGTLSPGHHKLRVTAIDKAPYESDIELAPHGARTVHVTLHDASKGPVWPWVVGGAALVAGTVVGGYFLFRSKDEPGAYQSGGLGTVVLPSSVRSR